MNPDRFVFFVVGFAVAILLEIVTLPSMIENSWNAVYDCSDSTEALLICRSKD